MFRGMRWFLVIAVVAGVTAYIYRLNRAVPLDANGELVLPFQSVHVTGQRPVLVFFHSPT